jgi:hypothetical protein
MRDAHCSICAGTGPRLPPARHALCPGVVVVQVTGGMLEVWVGPLVNGSFAVSLFNRSPGPDNITLTWDALPAAAGTPFLVRWGGRIPLHPSLPPHTPSHLPTQSSPHTHPPPLPPPPLFSLRLAPPASPPPHAPLPPPQCECFCLWWHALSSGGALRPYLPFARVRVSRDVWESADKGVFSNGYTATVPAHAAALLTLRPSA